MLVALKPPGGNGLPKYVLRSVHIPSVNGAVAKSMHNISVNKVVGNQSPNHSVHSGVQNGENSAKDQKVQIKPSFKKFKIMQ